MSYKLKRIYRPDFITLTSYIYGANSMIDVSNCPVESAEYTQYFYAKGGFQL